MKRHIDIWSLLVIIITFILFIIALFVKGMTHDLLLETGVFLVSVKLILMAYTNRVAAARIEKKLDEIKKTICS